MGTIYSEIKNPRGRVFKKLYIKRRLASTGLFETDWQEITEDVKSWGSISKSIDHVRYSRVRFSDVGIVMGNDYGRYNPEDDESSLWFGYASQQRTLLKIEAGFIHQTLGADLIYTNTLLPSDPTVFIGVIQGDISISDSNEIALPVKPLLQVFRDFSTRNLTGLTTTGMTAAQFIACLRDQTDGSSNYIFRPFFGDTTSNWEYTSSSIVYKDISSNFQSAQPTDTSTSLIQNDFLDMNVWDVIERLAEAENQIPYITRTGKFRFVPRSANTSTAQYGFFGRGYPSGQIGTTIKKVNGYKKKISDFYSRVEVKWNDIATSTAVVATQSAMVVGNNTAWNYGHRTYSIDNPWVATITSAQAIASAIFEAASSIPNEIDFSTSFVPHLEVLDLVAVNYLSSEADGSNYWDLNDWAEDTVTANDSDLIWSRGDALDFQGDEFKLTSITINLDSLECRFVGLKTGGVSSNFGGNTVGSAIVGEAILG
jgi:hypothetical protein